MKKIVVSLVIGIGLILLLGLAKYESKPQSIESGHTTGRYWQTVNDYKVIRASDLDKLQQNVNDKLNHGWRLMGGLSYFDNAYCQVMVK